MRLARDVTLERGFTLLILGSWRGEERNGEGRNREERRGGRKTDRCKQTGGTSSKKRSRDYRYIKYLQVHSLHQPPTPDQCSEPGAA